CRTKTRCPALPRRCPVVGSEKGFFMSDLIARTSEAPLPATVEAANAASAAKDWPRAAALWDELRAARPHDAHRWFAAGHAYSEARMLEQAERILGEAVTGVLARLGRQEESEQLLREAASRFPDEYWPNHAAARL